MTPDFPGTAEQTGRRTEAMTSYRVATGPWRDGEIPAVQAQGPLDQTAWRIDAAGIGTLEMMLPLRAQLLREGFELLYECETVACGGFDFRYGTDILPEPDMHVDLGDYRYLSARREAADGPEFASLIVSRSSDRGFVQLTRIGAFASPPPQIALSTKSPEGAEAPTDPSPADPAPTDPALAGAAPADPTPADPGAMLMQEGGMVLEGVEFPSGSAALPDRDYPALTALAGWLKQNPARRIALVGHTDASGGLEGNMALSRKRAESVRQALIDRGGIAAAQIVAQGVGYLAPRATNETEAGRERNRRVEAMLISP